MSVAGADSLDAKEAAVQAFLDGAARVLVTKPSIAGHGLNLQHCRHMAFVGLDDSYEQQYQAIRRCWHYGQRREVQVHFVTCESLGAIKANVQRKEAPMAQMQREMVSYMGAAMRSEYRGRAWRKAHTRATWPWSGLDAASWRRRGGAERAAGGLHRLGRPSSRR